jgi:hypothetical protein
MIMTAAQLAHLAELATLAADYFAVSNPDAARMFGNSAIRAETLSTEVQRRNGGTDRNWDISLNSWSGALISL